PISSKFDPETRHVVGRRAPAPPSHHLVGTASSSPSPGCLGNEAAEPVQSPRGRPLERIVPDRGHHDGVVGRNITPDSHEGFTFDVLVLGAEGHAAIISLVDILPEARVISDNRLLLAMQSVGVPPENENGVVTKQVALLKPGLPRPNKVVPMLKKFAATSSWPA